MNRIKELLKPKLKLLPGTRLTSFLFIAVSIAIAAGILFAANLYYDIDTSQIIVEEVQKATQIIKATAGLVVGADQTLPSGMTFLATSSNAVVLGGVNQELRFTAGLADRYVGFRATTSLETTTVYTWPINYPSASGQVLQSTVTGELSWLDLGAAGYGDILAVGDCPSGECFTQTSTSSSSLWFAYNAGGGTYYRGKLTTTALTADRTYYLPNLSGTITLTSGNLGTGNVLFADNGLIATSSDFTWATSTRTLTLGTTGSDGQLRIYSSNPTGYYLGFAATSTMTMNTPYYWPQNFGSPNYILTTNGSGQLSWQSVTSTGGVSGSGTTNRLAKWTDSYTLGNASIEDTASAVKITITDTTTTIANNLTVTGTGIHSFAGTLDPYQMDAFTLIGNITGSGNPNISGIGTFSGQIANLSQYVQTPLIQNTSELTIKTTAGNILLDPYTDIVQLATSTYIRTNVGYEIGRAGTQILREMVPIMGFDLPVRTATTSYVSISRNIESYPFQACATGTDRVHKMVIRYGASTSSNWLITGSNFTFNVPPSPGENLSNGTVYVASTTIPIPVGDCTTWSPGADTADWHVELKLPATGYGIQVYQIFLAAYDQIKSD